MAIITSWDGLLPNGIAPVNTFVQINHSTRNGKAFCLSQTSIITIANENISDSLLRALRSPETKISGAAHRASSQRPIKASRVENGSWLTTERPISVIRAQLEASTRMFGWASINEMTTPRYRTIAYSLEVSKNHTT